MIAEDPVTDANQPRVILISGAAGGIGSATAERFAVAKRSQRAVASTASCAAGVWTDAEETREADWDRVIEVIHRGNR